jgi:peptidoglycan/LPS O-acetylase OafA/YrhL
MGYHFGVGPAGGFLGVDLFFVISGFVITRLLLRQQAAGTLTMRRFYAHRVRRLLPALLFVLFMVQLWVWYADVPAMRSTVNSQTLAALGFFGNWYTIFADVDYWSVLPAEAPLNHLWSLAVEEQFYLVWPALVVVLVSRSGGQRLLTFATGMGAVVCYMLAAWNYVPGLPDRAYLGTDTRAGALCLGALAACVTHAAVSRTEKSRTTRRVLPLLVAAAVCILLMLWTHAAIDSRALYLWQLPLGGLAAATLITILAILEGCQQTHRTASLPETVVLKSFAARPVVAVGTISYGLYLWHWPVWVYLKHTFPQWELPTHQWVAVMASFTLSLLSYLLLESPARRCRLRTLLLFVASASVVVGSFALISTPLPQHGADGDGPVVSGVR